MLHTDVCTSSPCSAGLHSPTSGSGTLDTMCIPARVTLITSVTMGCSMALRCMCMLCYLITITVYSHSVSICFATVTLPLLMFMLQDRRVSLLSRSHICRDLIRGMSLWDRNTVHIEPQSLPVISKWDAMVTLSHACHIPLEADVS